MGKISAVIEKVSPNSIAEEIGIEEGDAVEEVNSQKIRDIIDYKFLTTESNIEIKVKKNTGEVWLIDIEKEPDEDLGICFYDELFDELKKCNNNCIFCFVDNLPKGLRENLYVKDDDYRYSFLYGNFITLSNLYNIDYKKIVDLRLSPLYVSVHSTNPNLRSILFRNKKAGNIMEQLKYLTSKEIEIHTQAVLCPGINDGLELERTINDLVSLWPYICSLGIVPVGLTKYNKNPQINTYDKKGARDIILYVEKKQQEFLKKIGSRFVFLSDEFYLKGDLDIPEDICYEGYPQFENGIGIARNFIEEFNNSLTASSYKRKNFLDVTIITGKASKFILEDLAVQALQKIDNLNLEVVSVENTFFGSEVTVSGLLTGQDIKKFLVNNKVKNKQIIIPDIMLKEKTSLFLDDATVNSIASNLQVNLKVLPTSGKVLADYLIGKEDAI